MTITPLDRRELILVRLLVLGTAVDDVVEGHRNKGELSEILTRPAFALFDCDETASDDDPKNRPTNRPQRMIMTPEMAFLISGTVATIGSLGNALRGRFIKAVKTDEALRALVQDQQGIDYRGCSPHSTSGRAVEGAMWMNFHFTYPLITDEL